MLVRTGRFTRGDRLLSRGDFERVRGAGTRRASREFVVAVVPAAQIGRTERSRLGMMVGRRVGNAVARNRLKRAVREWFRRSRGRLEEPLEIVVIARRGAAALSAQEVSEDLDELVFAPARD